MSIYDPSIYVDAIALLLHVNDDRTKRLVTDIVELANKKALMSSSESDLILFYINVIQEIINRDLCIKDPNELAGILIKYKSDPTIQKNLDIYNKLHEIFTNEEAIKESSIGYLSDRLHNVLIVNKASQQVRKMFVNLSKCEDINDTVQQQQLLDNVLQASIDVQTVFQENSTGGEENLVEIIDFTNKDSIQSAFEKFNERKSKNAIKLGLHGMNRIFDKIGPTLGETVVFNALSNNFKSGMLKKIASWIVKYNEPPRNEDGKKPLILFITLENEAFENLMWWFKDIYETTTSQSSKGLSNEFITNYVYDYFNERGYTFVIERYHPMEFGFEEFKKTYSKWEAAGYFICATIIDYMNKMKKGTSAQVSKVGNHLLIMELYTNLCNFVKIKGTFCATAHQLNREAEVIANSGVRDVVKKFNNSHMSYSSDIQREVDTSINLHLEFNHLEERFLTIKRTKRRYHDTTPEAWKYCAYKFNPNGIPDDVDGEDMSVSNIYTTKACIGDTGDEEAVEEVSSMF